MHIRFLPALVATLAPLAAQPSLTSGGIVNNASYFGQGTVGAGIAQGSVFAIFGAGFGPGGVIYTASTFPLQPLLAGVTVDIHSGAAVLSALPLYISANQIGAVLPSNTPLGAATLVVNYQGFATQPEPFTVVTRNFGVFTANQAGSGPGSIQNVDPAGIPTLNTLLNPATPGQAVTLWGTGAGPITTGDASPPTPVNLTAFNLTVYVGGIPATVLYRGRSSCCVGVDQINVEIPAGVSGCYVPVVVTGPDLAPAGQNTSIPTDHAVSNFSTISVAPAGQACTDPSGMSSSQLAGAASRGAFSLGSYEFLRAPGQLITGTIDSVYGGFGIYSPPSAYLPTEGVFGLPSVGSCLSYPMLSSQAVPPDPTRTFTADGGSTIEISTLINNVTVSQTVTRGGPGTYDATLGAERDSPQLPFLNPGHYTVTNSGGQDVASIAAFFTMPAPLTWTNASAGFNGVGAPTLTWTGGAAGTLAFITSTAYNDDRGFYTVCLAESTVGSFTIPTYAYSGTIMKTTAVQSVLALGAGIMSSFTDSGLQAGQIFASSAGDGVLIQQ